jgi:hypothetical protein
MDTSDSVAMHHNLRPLRLFLVSGLHGLPDEQQAVSTL